MSERYPSDAALLALSEDAETGVEYIPTGLSPYHLEFRKFIHRTLLASGRANDLRVYQDGDLTVGVRAGRCLIGNASKVYPGSTTNAITVSTTTHAWLDTMGVLQTGTSGLPTDRRTFLPLAEINSGPTMITSITDLRGEAFLAVTDGAMLGLTATIDRINEALDGTNPTVDAAALNTLTGGSDSSADTEHRHLQSWQDKDGEAYFHLFNDSSGVDANVALVLSLPNKLSDDTVVIVNRNNGFLEQRYDGTTYNLVGTVHVEYVHEGDITATQTGKLAGIIPVDGVVSDIIVSVGVNIGSDTGSDGVAAVGYVNGTSLTSTHPEITSADGSGTKSTAQGAGTSAVVKSDGTESVQRGDIITVDLTRTAVGTITTEAANVVAIVVIRVDGPE